MKALIASIFVLASALFCFVAWSVLCVTVFSWVPLELRWLGGGIFGFFVGVSGTQIVFELIERRRR